MLTSAVPPYIAEPDSAETYGNALTGLHDYLLENGSSAIGNATLGDDNWPTTQEDFYTTLSLYASFQGPGAKYTPDLVFDNSTNPKLLAYRVSCKYVELTKIDDDDGDTVDDSDLQIEAMDGTRDMVDSWTDLQPAFPHCVQFTTIEGFKVIQNELFRNVGLAVLAVAIIIFLTVASPVTSFLITVNVTMCLVEILGFMWGLGFAIDSVTVISLVLAVGLSVDYSAHVGHCFMTKSGKPDERVVETLADMGAAVLSGGMSTFLAVVVLLFSDSYVFYVLSRMFCLTVVLGLGHGLILLPVLLALYGPKPYGSANDKTETDVKATAEADAKDTTEETDEQK